MRRIACALAMTCLLTAGGLTEIANAGDYRGGYYVRHYDGHRYQGPRYYSEPYYRPRESRSYSSCCYKKITRYEKIYRDYPRHKYYQDHHPHRSYYADPYHRSYRYTRRHYHDGYHYRRPYYSGPRIVYSNRAHLLRHSSRYGYSDYGYGCYGKRRIKVPDGRGGWVWGYRLGC